MAEKLDAKLVVITGSMFVGKSTELISVGEKYKRAGYKVLYVKPALDDRYSGDHIVTHNGEKVKALSTEFEHGTLSSEEYDQFEDADVILIDEIQFFSEGILDELRGWTDLGKVMYVAGLDLDYNAIPFHITSRAMALADEVHKRKTVCSHCGKPSYVTWKKFGTDVRIELGSGDMYTAVCRECFIKNRRELYAKV